MAERTKRGQEEREQEDEQLNGQASPHPADQGNVTAERNPKHTPTANKTADDASEAVNTNKSSSDENKSA